MMEEQPDWAYIGLTYYVHGAWSPPPNTKSFANYILIQTNEYSDKNNDMRLIAYYYLILSEVYTYSLLRYFA